MHIKTFLFSSQTRISMKPELSIIIPAYNEEERILPRLREILHYIENHGIEAEIIVVDDGSEDDTSAIVESLKDKRIQVARYPRNRGKGYAVQYGVLQSVGENIFFSDIDLSFLQFISFIATIAALVQIVEMLLDRYLPVLYTALGIFLPLIAVNCSILGASLFMSERHYNFLESCVFGFSSGLGWMLAIVAMAAVQQKLKYAFFPKGLSGFAGNMIATGLISMTFLAFAGIKL